MHRLASIHPRSSHPGINLLSSCFVVFALASSPPSLAQTKESSEVATTTPQSIVKFGDKFQSAQRAPQQQTRIFVYRQTHPAYTSPVNIYLEGRFHTALLNGGYSEFCAAPGRLAFQSVYDDAQKMHLGKQVTGQPWELKAGNTLYLRVSETSAMSMSLIEVAPEEANKELSRTAAQAHVLSRAPAAQACGAPAPPPVATATAIPVAPAATPLVAAAPVRKPPVPRAYALQADALFEFGKTELKVSGYNAIEAMAQGLKQDFSQVERIRVVGHSDPIGNPKLNRALSLERAEKVANQMRDLGIKPLQGFKTEGQGAASQVKTDCSHKPSPASKLCHAPNRRVEIIVYGAKK